MLLRPNQEPHQWALAVVKQGSPSESLLGTGRQTRQRETFCALGRVVKQAHPGRRNAVLRPGLRGI
jgi:hypothetical protein